MGKRHAQSEAGETTTDNGDIEGKIICRKQALIWATGGVSGKPSVLETNAGEGNLFREIWSKHCGRHLGIDKRFSRPNGNPSGECWRGDNESLLKRAMSVGPWDVVDIDTYANPWPLLRRVLLLAPARSLVVTATCTVERAMQVNSSDFAFAVARMGKVANEAFHSGAPFSRWYDDVIRWSLAWAEEKATVQAVECKRIHADPKIAGSATRTRYYTIRYEPR